MKTVLITGASSGFGLDMVNLFLDDGWKVLATVRDVEKRQVELKDKIDLENKKLKLLELDVSKGDDISRIVSEVKELDVLVNNAGFGVYGALEDVTEEQIRYQMEVNFFGPVLLTKGLLPVLRKGQSKVINISSLMGRYACPLSSVYSASKYALEGLTEGLMYELKSHGVEVATIAPGGFRTKFTSSIVWGKNSFNSDSAYKEQTDGFKGLMEGFASRPDDKAPDSMLVAKKALSLANKSSMPRRVMVGKDAKFISLLQDLLPSPLYRKLMFTSNKKIFGS